jgi:curli production assembly/transport component CsgG
MVSVVTGEILIEVMSQKTIYSYAQSQDLFRFYEMGTELIEVEMGTTENESITLALMKAIEGAVLELILIGYERGYWKYEQTIN